MSDSSIMLYDLSINDMFKLPNDPRTFKVQSTMGVYYECKEFDSGDIVHLPPNTQVEA